MVFGPVIGFVQGAPGVLGASIAAVGATPLGSDVAPSLLAVVGCATMASAACFPLARILKLHKVVARVMYGDRAGPAPAGGHCRREQEGTAA